MAEARNQAEVRQALEAGADLIMLDNMTNAQVRRATREVDGRVPVEISGGVDLKRVRRLAGLGVDRVSIGALTHSAPALDVSLKYLD
jgi:nicotinate-nucleotide pyrophosphorylase (carboxylating)